MRVCAATGWRRPSAKSSAAGFHADRARPELGKKLEHAFASQRLAQHQLAAPIDPVQLENLLCDIHPDSCNLHSGPSRSSFSMVTLPSLGSYEAVEQGWVHLIILRVRLCENSRKSKNSIRFRCLLSPKPVCPGRSQRCFRVFTQPRVPRGESRSFPNLLQRNSGFLAAPDTRA